MLHDNRSIKFGGIWALSDEKNSGQALRFPNCAYNLFKCFFADH